MRPDAGGIPKRDEQAGLGRPRRYCPSGGEPCAFCSVAAMRRTMPVTPPFVSRRRACKQAQGDRHALEHPPVWVVMRHSPPPQQIQLLTELLRLELVVVLERV